MEIREAAKSAVKEQGYPDFKLEQLGVEEAFVKGCDVFAVLPTSYGMDLATCSDAERCKFLLSIDLQIRSLPQPTQYTPEGRRCI